MLIGIDIDVPEKERRHATTQQCLMALKWTGKLSFS